MSNPKDKKSENTFSTILPDSFMQNASFTVLSGTDEVLPKEIQMELQGLLDIPKAQETENPDATAQSYVSFDDKKSLFKEPGIYQVDVSGKVTKLNRIQDTVIHSPTDSASENDPKFLMTMNSFDLYKAGPWRDLLMYLFQIQNFIPKHIWDRLAGYAILITAMVRRNPNFVYSLEKIGDYLSALDPSLVKMRMEDEEATSSFGALLRFDPKNYDFSDQGFLDQEEGETLSSLTGKWLSGLTPGQFLEVIKEAGQNSDYPLGFLLLNEIRVTMDTLLRRFGQNSIETKRTMEEFQTLITAGSKAFEEMSEEISTLHHNQHTISLASPQSNDISDILDELLEEIKLQSEKNNSVLESENALLRKQNEDLKHLLELSVNPYSPMFPSPEKLSTYLGALYPIFVELFDRNANKG